MASSYTPRYADIVLGELLRDVPGILLTGPRASGKSTTALRHAKSVVRLDDPAEANAFRRDPDAALARLPEPVLLDEWHLVPEVLGAVKRSLDTLGFRPGRFLVSGSVRDDLLADSWPITGRLIRVEMSGLSVREILGRDLTATPFLRRLANGELVAPVDPPHLIEYLEHALNGGYPEPVLGLPQTRRRAWLTSYLDRVLTRDARDVDVPRDPVRLGRYLRAFALSSAGVVSERTLLQAADINRMTGQSYERLLHTLLLVDSLPAWSSNRIKRLMRAPKRFVRDPALAAAAIGVGLDDLMRDGDALGRLVETFVLMQVRAEQCLYDQPPGLFHLRQDAGAHEIDLIAELNYRQVLGVEVKARSAVTREHAKHLIWLRDQLGEDFVRGVVLHTGPHLYELDDRILAAPIACIWA